MVCFWRIIYLYILYLCDISNKETDLLIPKGLKLRGNHYQQICYLWHCYYCNIKWLIGYQKDLFYQILKHHQIILSNNTLTDDDRKRLIRDWLWEIEQELPEISSSSLSPESKDKIKTLLNQIGDIVVVVEEEKNEEEEEKE